MKRGFSIVHFVSGFQKRFRRTCFSSHTKSIPWCLRLDRSDQIICWVKIFNLINRWFPEWAVIKTWTHKGWKWHHWIIKYNKHTHIIAEVYLALTLGYIPQLVWEILRYSIDMHNKNSNQRWTTHWVGEGSIFVRKGVTRVCEQLS